MAGKPVDREQVSEGFEHVHPRARQVIERGENWKLWVLCDRDPIVDWVDGRVTLLGGRRASHAAVFRPGCLHGHGGRRMPGSHDADS